MLKHNVIGFVQFIREQGIMGLAIGFILGGAVSGVVKSFVDDIINPLIGTVFGSITELSDWTIGTVTIGNFLSVLINFVIIAAVVYFIFRGLSLDTLDVKKS